MSVDIGAKIGIDGEKAFRDSLAAINSQMKSLGSEMKAVVSSFAGMEDSEEAVTARTNVLQRSISASADKMSILQGHSERAKAKLHSLAEELEKAKHKFGENSEQALKAQNAYNKQVVAVNKLETQIHQTTAELNRMERELRDVGEAADAAGADLKRAAQDADTAGSSFRDAFLGGALSGAVQSLASGMLSLVESTTEYRKIMGTLEASSEKAGYSAEQTANSYQQLYGVIGDNQQTATALANLQALGLSQEQLKQMTEGAIGAWATYGDSIPIDGLAEAINETIQAGVVTGSFADMLNWAGTSEDAFNAKLEAAGSQAERANLVLQEMANQGLMQTAEAWRQNNTEIVAANEATANLEQNAARLGEMLSPVVTELKMGMAEILSTMLDMVEEGHPLISVVTGLSVALASLGLATFITQAGSSVVMLTKMKAAFAALTVVMKANPILLVASLLAGLTASLVTAYQTNDTFREKVDTAWAALQNNVSAAVERVKGYVDALRQKFQSFVSWAGTLQQDMRTLGNNVITGLWNGINEKLQWIRNKIRAAVESIKSQFTGVTGFDTHSPSKWSGKIARWVMQGMGNEFKGNTFAVTAAGGAVDNIKKRMQNSLQNINASMESIVTPRAAAATVQTTNNYTHGGINVYVDTVNNANDRDVQTLGRELNFITKQTAWGRGGAL